MLARHASASGRRRRKNSDVTGAVVYLDLELILEVEASADDARGEAQQRLLRRTRGGGVGRQSSATGCEDVSCGVVSGAPGPPHQGRYD